MGRRNARAQVRRDGACAYHHFSGRETRECLAARGVRLVTFLGDSIVRDLYEALDRRLDLDVDVDAIKAVRFGAADVAARRFF